MTEASETEQGDRDAHEQGDRDAAPDESNPSTPAEPDPETFPREYVENLRKEAAEHRVRAKAADDLARRLHLELVRATGRLADPTDLLYDPNHLEDVSILEAALDDLLGRKPHLASRRPAGDIGQGATSTADSVNLAGILRARAG